MALPVGKPTESNKELELVASLLEKTLQELEETQKGFKEFKIKSEEREQKFVDFANNIVNTLKEKEFTPNITVSSPLVWVDDKTIGASIKQAIEPKRFWRLTENHFWLIFANIILVILVIFNTYYNFSSVKKVKADQEIISKIQNNLFNAYTKESQFWYSKADKRLYISSIEKIEGDKQLDKIALEKKQERAKEIEKQNKFFEKRKSQ